jgi:methylated-DNA-protein-cysteine methyltransferase-like protein
MAPKWTHTVPTRDPCPLLHPHLPYPAPLTFGDDTPVPTRADAVIARIRDTPPGFVRAYGDVSPGAPRFAGTVLAATDDPTLPWHRIVRADGSLAKGARQRALLEEEGVPFKGDRVDMRIARLPA